MRNIPQSTPSFSSLSRPIYSFEKDAEIANFVRSSNTAIGYVGYPSFFTKQDRLSTVAIQNNEGNFIIQNEMSIASNMYNPLSKQLYMIVPNETLSITRYFLEFAYSNYGDKILQDSGYIQIPTNEQLIMLTSLESIERPNCISLGSIECCAGKNQLKMFVVDDTERYFSVWKIYFEAACPTTYIMLTNTKSSLPPIFRAGKISPESNFLDIAAVGSHIHQNNKRDLYPVSKPTFTYKCTKNQALCQAYSPPRTLAEFTIAPNPE